MRREPAARQRHLGHLLCAAAIMVAKASVVIVAASYLVYLVAIHVFLWTPLFAMAVNGDPRTLDVHFDHGWSLWPGRIHARHLSIRSRDESVEWMLRIRDVQFDLSFLALPHQRFAASHVRGAGGSFRLRTRLDPPDVSPERLAGLPSIEGFPAVPVRPYRQCSADEWSDADYHLWTIQLDDVHAEAVQELWIDRYRLDGDTATSGRFYLKPARAIDVGPLHSEHRGIQLSVGGVPWVEGLDASVDFTLPRFDPRVASGEDMLHLLSFAIESHGVWPEVGRLPLPLPGDVEVHGALEVRRLALRFEEGGPLAGSHLELVAPQAVALRGEHRIASSLAATADIEAGPPGLAFHALAGAARLERGGQPVVVVPRLDIVGKGTRPDVDHGIQGLHVTLESPSIELPDVRALASYVPRSAPVTLAGGHARADLWAEAWLDEGRAAGRASMQAEDLDVHVADVHATGRVAAKASVASADWRTGRLDRPTGDVTVTGRAEVQPRAATGPAGAPAAPPEKAFAADVHAVALAHGYEPSGHTFDVSGSGVTFRNMVVAGEPAPSSHGEATLREATVRLDEPALQGVAAVDVTDATSLVASLRDHVPGPFRGLMDLPRLLASAHLSASPRSVQLADVEAHGGALAVNGLFAARSGDHLGAFVVRGGPITIGLGVDPKGTHVHFFGLSGWLEGEQETVAQRFGRAHSRPPSPLGP